MENILKVLMTLDSKQLVQGLNQAQSNIDRFSGSLRSVGKTLMTRVSAPLSIVGGMALKQSMNFQRLRMSLETLAGGAEAGGAAFEELVKFSAKTPFQLNELVRINNMLMGFGLNTQQARESLKLLGDVAAVSGGDLTGMAVAFGQSAAEGRVMTRDLLQFINNGVPLLKLLAEELGTTTTRVREMASEGQLSFPLVVKALERATSAGGMFENGMGTLSKTLQGTYSNIKDNLIIALASLGDQIVETFDIEQLGKDFVGFIQDITTSFKELEPATRDLIVQIAAFAASAGPLMYLAGSVIPKLIGSIRLLIANPIIAGLTAAAGALGMLIDRVGFIEDTNEKAKNAQKGILEYGAALKNLESTSGYLAGNEESLRKWHEMNLKLQESIKANAEAQIDFAKELGPDGQKTVNEYSQQLKLAEGNILASQAAIKSLNEQAKKTPGLEEFKIKTGEVKESAEEFDASLNKMLDASADLGKDPSFGSIFGTDPIAEMLKAGQFDPNSVQVADEVLTDDSLDALGVRMQKFRELMNQIPAVVEQSVEQGLMDLGVAIGEALSSGGNVLQAGAASIVNTIANLAISLGRLAIQVGVTVKGVKEALKSLHPVVAIAAGVALIAAGTFFKNQAANLSGGGATAFANGGIVSGPTLGLIGEYSGARSNPEVVAPLNKLQGMLAQSGGQNVNVGGEFRIQGQDLVVALQRADRNRKRIL